MTAMERRPLVWVAPVASALLLTAAGALAVVQPAPPLDGTGEVLPLVALAAVLPLLGAIVLRSSPGHPVAMLWTGVGLAGGLALVTNLYAFVALERDLPLALASAWIGSWVWTLAAPPLLTFGLLLFPDGRLPSHRWRPFLAVAAGAVLLPAAANAFAPGRLANHPVDNPLGVAGLADAARIASGLGFACFTLGVAGGAASLVVRWRRGDPVLRRQLTLPAVCAALLAATFLVPVTEPLRTPLDLLAMLELALLFAAFAVAVRRDGVAGSRVALRRSLVYGLLTGALTLAYATCVLTLDGLLPNGTASLAGTVGTALLALPLRDRLQLLVDRALYGERSDPFRALDRLGDRLDTAADPESALVGVAESVATILRLPAVRVLVRDGAHEVSAAEVGAAPATTRWTRLPLRHHGEEVGGLLVAPRPGQADLDPRDLRMLDALRSPAAAAVAAVRMTGELQLSRRRLVAAREEERRRLRRDLHDGLGPTLAGIGLGLDVARAAVDDDHVRVMLDDLKAEAAAAVVDVRRLVEDLRPPALDELGLVGALQRHAERLSLREGTEVAVTTSCSLAGLPAAVEVAAYRIAMEAMTNAIRHGSPAHCSLTLRLDDALHVEVVDDGVGVPAQPPAGVGLAAMRERADELGGSCTIEPRPGGGTAVLARLPVQGR